MDFLFLDMFENPEPKLTIYNSSAGSGKTYTLATEFIRFALQDQNNYRRILAITFTNKATAEMKERILKFIKTLKNNSDAQLMQLMHEKTGFSEKEISKRSTTVLSNILHNYSFFSVNTIDSFFQRLIKSFAAELNIYINYELLLDPTEVVDWVVDEMMERSFDDQKLKNWIQNYVDYKIDTESSIFNIKNIFQNVSKDIFNNNEKEKIELNNQQLQDLSNVGVLLENHKSIINSFEKKMDEFGAKGRDLIHDNGFEFSDFKGGKNSVANVFKKILKDTKNYVITDSTLKICDDDTNWVTKTNPRKNEIYSFASSNLTPLLNQIVDFKESNYVNYQTSKEILKNIYAFGLTNYLEGLKEEYVKDNNLLLLSDSVNHISDLIKEDEDTPFLYDKIGTYFRYILLDESQDTSQSQWNNLLPLVKNCLAEGGEVIVVGDVKQSIYRWRGGDVNLLVDGIKTDVYPFSVENQNLVTNYRSSKVVVESNNTLLEKCLNVLINEGYENLVNYYDVFKQDAFSKAKGRVTYTRINSDKDFEEQSLEFTLQKINELVKEHNFNYNDITILVRKNKESAVVAEFLKEKNIPVLSSEALYIQNSEDVRFLISVLKIIQFPKDDIAKVEVLNYLGLSLDGIKSKTYLDVLPSDFTGRIEEISKLDIYSAVEILISIFSLEAKSSAYFVELLNLVLDYSSKYSTSILSFLEYWDEKIIDGNQSINVPEGENAVNIVSVHKSKGLEFPIVIIPFANWSLRPHKDSTFWFQDKQESSLYFPLNYTNSLEETVFEEDFKSELSLNILDGMNELYVAVTRAAEQLHIHFDNPAPPKKKPKEIKIDNVSKLLLNALSSDFSDDKNSIEFGEIYSNQFTDDTQSKNISIENLVVHSESPEIALINKDDDEARREGKLLHSIMEDLVNVSDWQHIKQKVLLSGEVDLEAIDRIEGIIGNVLSIPEYKNLIASDYKIFSELEIYSVLDDRSYVPDRLFVKNDEVVIVDFKSRYNKSSESKYRRQLLGYKKLLLEIGYNNVKPHILYLEEAKMIEIS